MSEQIEIKLPDLARVALEPGDTVLVRHPKYLDKATAAALGDNLKNAFPDHRILILEGGLELAVVRPTDPSSDHAWRLNAIQFLLQKTDEAMRKERVVADLRCRVMNRLMYGEPNTDERGDADQELASGGSL